MLDLSRPTAHAPVSPDSILANGLVAVDIGAIKRHGKVLGIGTGQRQIRRAASCSPNRVGSCGVSRDFVQGVLHGLSTSGRMMDRDNRCFALLWCVWVFNVGQFNTSAKIEKMTNTCEALRIWIPGKWIDRIDSVVVCRVGMVIGRYQGQINVVGHSSILRVPLRLCTMWCVGTIYRVAHVPPMTNNRGSYVRIVGHSRMRRHTST